MRFAGSALVHLRNTQIPRARRPFRSPGAPRGLMPRSARTIFYLLRYCPQSIFADRGLRLACDPPLMGYNASASIRPTARRVTRTFEEAPARVIFC